MTLRAVIFGLVGALFIAVVGYFNDQVPRVNYFVGNHFPIVVFFPLLLVGVLVNPLLERFKPGSKLRAAEMAIITVMMLIACSVPGSGMLRFWSRNVAMPVHFVQANDLWKQEKLLQDIPPELLTDGGVYSVRVNQGIRNGLGSPDAPIGLGDVPWAAWRRPMTAWIPIVALVGVASICLALIVHRTWATHDRLPYPIAQVAEAMMVGEDSSQTGSIFRSKLFWTGAIIVFVIHIVNGLNAWMKGRGIEVPLYVDISALSPMVNDKGIVMGRWAMGWPYWKMQLWPTALAFACLVAADVSFALGISPAALTIATTVLFTAGVPAYGSTMRGGLFQWQSAGSYLGIALILVYLGRRTYWRVFRSAVTFRPDREVRPYEAWALRVLVVVWAVLVLLLAKIGLSWPLALLFTGMMLVMFLVMARINAESGLILIETWWQPLTVLLGLLGIRALGLGNFAIMAMLGLQFTINARECLLPFAVNALRICDFNRVPAGRAGATGGIALVVVLLVAVPLSLWVDYNYGLRGGEGFPQNAPARNLAEQYNYSKSMTAEEKVISADLGDLQRLTMGEADPMCLIAIGAGLGVVLLVSALRLRFTWWPLHPVLFLFWGTWAMGAFAFSFLVGWVIRVVTSRLGVPHRTLRTLMIGVIAGDLVGGAMWMLVGSIYFAVTHERPVRYLVFPGG